MKSLCIAGLALCIALVSTSDFARAANVHAQSARACAQFGAKEAPGVHYSQIRAASTTCVRAKRVIRAWREGLNSGTRQQRMCSTGQGVMSASCSVGSYRCRVTDVAVGGPANNVRCRVGGRRVAWRADFYN